MPRWPKHLPFCDGGLLVLNWSNDVEYLPTADLDDPVWSKEPVPDS